MGIGDDRIAALWQGEKPLPPGEELLALYAVLIEAVKKQR